MDFFCGLFPLLFTLFYLFMVCQIESLDLLGCSLWGYYSWCNKLPVGSGHGFSAIGNFPSNFSQGAVPASELLGKPELTPQSLLYYAYFDSVFNLSDVSIWTSI